MFMILLYRKKKDFYSFMCYNIEIKFKKLYIFLYIFLYL